MRPFDFNFLFCRVRKCQGLILALVALVGLTAVPARAQTLSHGPVTGGVDANDARVFVRTSAGAAVVVQYSTDPGLNNPSSSAPVTTNPARDFTAIVQLSSLTPLTTYYLNVEVNGVAQLSAPYPSFTTFPVQGTAVNFKFIVLTDFQSYYQLTSDSPSFQSAAAENPAFVFIGGDFDHSNPPNLAAHQELYRTLYNPSTVGMTDFVNFILLKMPIVHQWDDHDSGINNDDKTSLNWSDAYQSYTEYVPSYNLAGPASSFGIWQKFSYGQADFFVLDCRSQRDSEYAPDDVNKNQLNGRHLGLSSELVWLENNLLSSTATWKVVFSSVPTNPSTKYPDSWAGFQSEWNQLRTFIQQNGIKNVFFISGDGHFGAIDSGVASGFPEMEVTNVNITTPSGATCATGTVGTWDVGTYVNQTGSCQGYGVVTISAVPSQALLQVKDSNGNVKVSYTLSAH